MPLTNRSLALRRLGQALGAGFRLDAVVDVDVLAHTFLATRPSSDRAVISVLRPELASVSAIASHFARAAQVVSMIGGHSVPTVLDTGRTPDGLPFVAFEHVPGETLEAFLERRRSNIAPLDGAADRGGVRAVVAGTGQQHPEPETRHAEQAWTAEVDGLGTKRHGWFATRATKRAARNRLPHKR
jgi:hypothetical protein